VHFEAQAGSLRYHNCAKNYIGKDFLLTPGEEYFSLNSVEEIKNMQSIWVRYFYFSFYYFSGPECASTFKRM